METKHPLIILYGDNAFDLVLNEIKELATSSNIPFDKNYVDLGISFLKIKANEIVKEEKKKCSLRSLVVESFGGSRNLQIQCCRRIKDVFRGGVLILKKLNVAVDTLIQEGYSMKEIRDALKELLKESERYEHDDVFND